MRGSAPVYTFGAFTLDTASCRLVRGDALVDLSPRLYDLLRLLVSRPGELMTKEQLLEALWPGVFVTENSLTRAVSDLRLVLDDDAGAPRFVQTVARRGYRFVAPVEVTERPARGAGDAAAEDPLGSYRAWAEGRLRLESLSRDALPGAIASIEHARSLAPRDPLVHVALASAHLLAFEATRATHAPDRAQLARAVVEAREGCALAPRLGEAWATLGFVLVSAEEPDEARAAARRAVDLEPGDWRHQFRLAHATWGEERLRAVDRTLALFPDFAFAHFLAAMVHIARGALMRRTGRRAAPRRSRPADCTGCWAWCGLRRATGRARSTSSTANWRSSRRARSTRRSSRPTRASGGERRCSGPATRQRRPTRSGRPWRGCRTTRGLTSGWSWPWRERDAPGRHARSAPTSIAPSPH